MGSAFFHAHLAIRAMEESEKRGENGEKLRPRHGRKCINRGEQARGRGERPAVFRA